MAESAVPILPSRNLDETLAFYERLGALVDPSGNLVRVGSPLTS